MPKAADPHVRQFLNHTAGTVQRTLRMANDVCAEYQGDPASALLAALLSEQCEVPLHLLWLRPADATEETTSDARRLARHLQVPLVELRARHAGPPSPEAAFDETLAREAASFTQRLVTLRGARQTFAPRPDIPASHFSATDEELAVLGARHRLQFRHPFEDENLRRFLGRPLAGPPEPAARDGGLFEPLLEAALAQLGVPGRTPAPAPARRYAGPTESL